MGCSYDPIPYDTYPSPRQLWMKENGFGSVKAEYTQIGSYCHECGAILFGHQHGHKFLKLHLAVCPIKPREEIPEKTNEECKEEQYKEVVWR